jgi:hypothetical protein
VVLAQQSEARIVEPFATDLDAAPGDAFREEAEPFEQPPRGEVVRVDRCLHALDRQTGEQPGDDGADRLAAEPGAVVLASQGVPDGGEGAGLVEVHGDVAGQLPVALDRDRPPPVAHGAEPAAVVGDPRLGPRQRVGKRPVLVTGDLRVVAVRRADRRISGVHRPDRQPRRLERDETAVLARDHTHESSTGRQANATNGCS